MSTPAHLALSTKIAADGTVLLKNARSVLPLNPSVKSIAVIGDAASEHPQTAAGGSATVLPSQPIVTPLAGITTRAGAGVHVTHAQGTLGVAGALPPSRPALSAAGWRCTYYASADLSGAPFATGTVPNLDYTGDPPAVAGSPGLVGAIHRHDHRARHRRLPVLALGRRQHPGLDRRRPGRQLRADPRAEQLRAGPPHGRPAHDQGRGDAAAGHPRHRRRVRRRLRPAPRMAAAGEPHGRRRPRRRPRRRRSRRRRVRPGLGGHGPHLAGAAQRPGPAHLRGRRGQPAHHRRPEQLECGDDAMARLRRRGGRGLVPGPDLRDSAGPGAVR